MKTLIIILLSLSIVNLVQAQNLSNEQAEMQKKVEEIMKNRERLFNSLLNDDSFREMEKRMEEMMKNFDNDDFDLGANSFFGGSIVGEYDWKDTETQKILAIKVKQIKDRPLDIKIEKGQIIIKGEVEEVSPKNAKRKIQKKVHFERVFSIPKGVDEKNPEFENKDGELLIMFKKLRKDTKQQSNIKTRKTSPNPEEERIPVAPDKNDISL